MPRTSTWSSLAVLGPVRRCALLLRGSMLCAWCGVPLTYDTAQIDHVRRREDGGSDATDNLVGCCPGCNLDRPARRPRGLALAWYPWLPARDAAQAEGKRRREERRRHDHAAAVAQGLDGDAFPFGACA